ncbi:hypothetical protein FRB90_012478 [Tulasnella sp. 427]|nr:hypothetical protein FRB90_012478 [Tulasnella sp. 427]
MNEPSGHRRTVHNDSTLKHEKLKAVKDWCDARQIRENHQQYLAETPTTPDLAEAWSVEFQNAKNLYDPPLLNPSDPHSLHPFLYASGWVEGIGNKSRKEIDAIKARMDVPVALSTAMTGFMKKLKKLSKIETYEARCLLDSEGHYEKIFRKAHGDLATWSTYKRYSRIWRKLIALALLTVNQPSGSPILVFTDDERDVASALGEEIRLAYGRVTNEGAVADPRQVGPFLAGVQWMMRSFVLYRARAKEVKAKKAAREGEIPEALSGLVEEEMQALGLNRDRTPARPNNLRDDLSKRLINYNFTKHAQRSTYIATSTVVLDEVLNSGAFGRVIGGNMCWYPKEIENALGMTLQFLKTLAAVIDGMTVPPGRTTASSQSSSRLKLPIARAYTRTSCREISNEAVAQDRDYLFSIMGRQLQIEGINDYLVPLVKAHLSEFPEDFTISDARQALTYVGHKVVGNCATEQRLVDLDMQAGHSSEIAKRWYGTEQKLGGSLSEEELPAFRDISFAHHQASGVDRPEMGNDAQNSEDGENGPMEVDEDGIEDVEVGIKPKPITPSPAPSQWGTTVDDDEDDEVEELPSDEDAQGKVVSVTKDRTKVRPPPAKISVKQPATKTSLRRHAAKNLGMRPHLVAALRKQKNGPSVALRSLEQAAAARVSDGGANVLVVLVTGMGKTEVFLLNALVERSAPKPKTTLIMVPLVKTRDQHMADAASRGLVADTRPVDTAGDILVVMFEYAAVQAFIQFLRSLHAAGKLA